MTLASHLMNPCNDALSDLGIQIPGDLLKVNVSLKYTTEIMCNDVYVPK